jgi:hypothetical protein
MNYILITSNGRILPFYVQEVAQMYQIIYGGTMIDKTVVSTQQVEKKVLTQV